MNESDMRGRAAPGAASGDVPERGTDTPTRRTASATPKPVRKAPQPEAPDLHQLQLQTPADPSEGLLGSRNIPREKVELPKHVGAGILARIPWLDVIMIGLTLAGIGWVGFHFDAVTAILAMGICNLVKSVVGIVLIAALIVGALLLLFRPRRYYRRGWW